MLLSSNTDTGWLQVQFLAGSLQRPIYQLSEEQHLPLYNMPVFPCSCCADLTRDPISIMWLRMTDPDADNPMPAINHIEPLIPLSGIQHSACLIIAIINLTYSYLHQVRVTTEMQTIKRSYLGEAVTRCCAKCVNCETEDCEEWVQCDVCQVWYHCVCVGMSPLYFEAEEFVCCRDQEEQQKLQASM